jgi:hypothetical protein
VVRDKPTQLTDDQILRDLPRRISQLEASSTVQQGYTTSTAHRFPNSYGKIYRFPQYGTQYGRRTQTQYQNSSRGNIQSSYRYRRPEAIRCYLCGMEGHFQRQCPTGTISVYPLESVRQSTVSTSATTQAEVGQNVTPLVANRVHSDPRGQLVGTYLDARLESTRIASQNAMHKQFLAIQFTFCIAAGCDAKLAL